MTATNKIEEFLKYLSLRGVSQKSLKYYKSDIVNFLHFSKDRKIDRSLVTEYIETEKLTTPLSTLNRRLSTLRSYSSFMGHNFMEGVENVSSYKKIIKSWQDRILAKFETKPKIKNALFKVFFTRPNWYKKYHSYPLATYIHIAILILFTSVSGYAFYDQVFYSADRSLAFPAALTRPNRFLSFQGRLTSNVGNPITTATNVVFRLYDASSGGTTLWNSGTCSITPDQDGIFSTLLGSSCGAEIASSVFSENSAVWVGVTVAADAEATPRIQIATVAYALNSETLQGFPAGTGTSTIPYINSSGTLVLANASPKLQSTSGTFAVEGLAMTISTPNTSNGVVTINPDGVGTLDLTFEGAAPGLSANGFVNATNANITSGSLYSGTVASAASGYNFINFLSGVSPTSKFSVDSTGLTTVGADLYVSSGISLYNNAVTDDTVEAGKFCTGDGETNCVTDFSTFATTSKWNALTAPDGALTLAMGVNPTTFGWTPTGALDAFTMNVNNNGGSTTAQNGLVINNAVVGAFTDVATESLLKLQQLDTTGTGTTAVTDALLIDSAGNSGITDAIHISNTVGNITNAIDIADTTGTIDKGIVLSGTFTTAGIDAGNSIITNIGAAGTDFTSGGGLTLATGTDLTIGAIGLNDVGSTNITSGASLIGAFDEFDNSASTTVQDVLDDLDAAITTGGGSSIWSLASAVISPTTTTNDFAIGGTTLAASIFSIDESLGTFLFGGDQSANPTLNFEATDSDAGTFGFNTSDAFYFSGANVGIGTTTPSSSLQITGGGAYLRTLVAPTGVVATCSDTGGTLVAGTYYYKVSYTDGNGLESIASSETSSTVTTGSTGSCSVAWTDITGFTAYRIYGRSTAAQDQYWSDTATPYLDTGTTGTIAYPSTLGVSELTLGRVGIGSRISASPLHVSTPATTAFVNALTLDNPANAGGSGTAVGMRFRTLAQPSDSYAKAGIIFENTAVGFGLGSLHLTVDGTGDSSNADVSDARLTIQYNGYVGIGTTGPTSKLHVNGISTGKALAIFNETGNQNILTASQSGIPVFNLARVSGTAANGFTFTPSATGNTVAQTAFGSDTNVAMSIDGKGSGALNLNGTATGDILIGGGSGSTGCTVANATGTLTCTVGITASALRWDQLTAPSTSLTLAMGVNPTTFGWTPTGALDAFTFNINNNGGSATNQNGLVINNAVVGLFTDTATESLLKLQQLDTTVGGTTAVTDALLIDSAGNSGITDAIHISNTVGNITNGIDIADTTGTINKGIVLSGTFTTAGIDLGNSAVINAGNLTFSGGAISDGTDEVDISDDLAISGVLQVGGTTAATYSRLGIATTAHGGNISASNDLLLQDLEIDGTLFMDGGILANSAGASTITFSATPTTLANYLTATNWVIENPAGGNVGHAALIVNQTKAGDLFTASASGTPKFVITNAGRVGVGTNLPNYQLDVVGDDDFRLVGAGRTDGITLQHVSVGNYTNTSIGTGSYTVNSTGGGLVLAGGTSTDDVTVSTGDTNATRMTIKGGAGTDLGYVGIGVTAPAANLHLQGFTAPNSTTYSSHSFLDKFEYKEGGSNLWRGLTMTSSKNSASADWSYTGIRLNSSIASGSYAIDNGYNNLSWIEFGTSGTSGYSGDIRFGTGNSATNERMRIDSTGNVGIGTTAPGGKLVVSQVTSDAIILRLSNASDTSGFDFTRISATGALSIQGNQTGFNNILLAPTSGNVGIGITAPDQLVTVANAANKSGFNLRQSTTNEGLYLTSDGGGQALISGGAEYTGTAITDANAWTFRAAGGASGIWQSGGAISFHTDSTTAIGNTFTPSYRMTINNSGNVGIGTTTPTQKLNLKNGHLRFDQVDAPGAPTVAVNATAGNLNGAYYYRISFVTAVGETESGIVSSVVSPVNQQVNLSAIPVSADTSVTSRKIYRSTAGGLNSLLALVATIADNTTTTYTDNIADASLGVKEPRVNTTGGVIYNGTTRAGIIDPGTTALGLNALSVNTGWHNTAVGINTLLSNTTGYQNTAIGLNALYNITTGYYNDAIGVNAGRYISGGATANQTSNTSLYLGNSTKALANGDTNEIVIGYNATGLGTNTVVLGNTSIGTTALRGNVGIGVTSPGSKLQITGSSSVYNGSSMLGLTTGTGTSTDESLFFGVHDGDYSWIQAMKPGTAYRDIALNPNAGNVGVGDTTPDRLFDVKGNVCLDLNADEACTDNTAALSDARLKTNITSITDNLELVQQLKPVRFTWNGEYNTGDANSLGFLAQDVEQIFPELVITDTAGYKNLDYSKLTAVLAGAIQELDRKIESMKTSEIISPIANTDLIIDLQPDDSQTASKLVIKGDNNEEVAVIDGAGNAEFAGDATISGTLYANQIESERLDEIEALLAEVEGNQALFAEAINWSTDTATSSATISDVIASNLFVTGNATVTSLFVAENLTAKSLDSIDGTLSIQSLAIAPIEIMAGKIKIDTDGNALFTGNLEVAGNLKVLGNLIIGSNTTDIATESATIIEGQINSNSIAGTAILTANTTELKIINNKVKTNSLIYVTPVSSTQNKVLYVKSKDLNEFTIGFNEAIDTDVEFNWWIIDLN